MSVKRTRDKKIIALLVLLAAVLIVLNLYTFISAMPETSAIDSGCCTNHMVAKDFSAYYVAAWRLLHDPSNIYTKGNLNDGLQAMNPQPQGFKYLPSVLFIFSVRIPIGKTPLFDHMPLDPNIYANTRTAT